ncbi:oxidoreductase [Bacteroides fragilis]|nr:oxidoreductase [Bacteroides fragilis]
MPQKAVKPVYIEKPKAQSYEECARINRISQETGYGSDKILSY